MASTDIPGENKPNRFADMLGDGPRIEPLSPEELTPEVLAIHQGVRKIADRVSYEITLENLPEIFGTLARHPQLLKALMQFGVQMLGEGELDARDRELAVLRIAWLCQAPYEWGEHVIIAKRAGLDSETIERIVAGSAAPGWSPRERALVRAAEELHAEAKITDETWAALAGFLDNKQLIELPVLIGYYQTVAYYQNALRLRLHEGNLGLDAR